MISQLHTQYIPKRAT